MIKAIDDFPPKLKPNDIVTLIEHYHGNKKLLFVSSAATGYLGRAYGNQNAEKRHRTFSNLVLPEKLCEVVRFFCEIETGGVLLPEELDTNETVATE